MAWTGDQLLADRQEATVKRFYYETHDQLREHLAKFVAAYNFAKRLKTLQGLTPYEFVCKCWTKRTPALHIKPAPSNPGSKHLDRGTRSLPSVQPRKEELSLTRRNAVW